MLELIFHGRGGQGAVTSSEVLASAASKEGYQSQAFSFFGAERRGAPVFAFLRIDEKKILKHGMFFKADGLIVLDKGLFNFPDIGKVTVKKGGIILINTEKGNGKTLATKVKREGTTKVFSVNATKIAIDHDLVLAGWPLVNMPILGALIKIMEKPSLSSLQEAVKEKLTGKMVESNLEAVVRAFNEVYYEGEI
jgi:pyruvate ferredoxin oxidoreductase gamma subunit